MESANLWPIMLQVGQPTELAAYMAHAVVGVFATVLFLLSVYAWSRRRHVGLLLVSSAFLVFMLKEVFWFVTQMFSFYTTETGELTADLITVLTDLVVLGLFFAAMTVRSRKQLEASRQSEHHSAQ